jgi:hypothetical protein
MLRQRPNGFRNACVLSCYEIRTARTDTCRVCRQALDLSLGTAPQGPKSSARRSTRLSLQTPVVITSLDPARTFAGKHGTLVVNAHGCGVIVREQLEKATPMTVELVSNGRIKKARVVLVRPLMEGVSCWLGLEFDHPACDFWEIEIPPADWRTYSQ